MGRGIVLAVLIFAQAASAEEKTPAEKLFDSAAQKLAAAKSLHVVCKAREPREGGDRHDAEFWIASDNRARIDFDWARGAGAAVVSKYVSDGKKATSSRVAGERKPDENLAASVRTAFLSAGVFGVSDASRAFETGEKPEAKFALTGWKMGKKEKVGKVEAQAIEFVVNAGKADEAKTVLWLDVKTGLPVKRQVDMGGFVLVETYEVMELDVKLADAVFNPRQK